MFWTGPQCDVILCVYVTFTLAVCWHFPLLGRVLNTAPKLCEGRKNTDRQVSDSHINTKDDVTLWSSPKNRYSFRASHSTFSPGTFLTHLVYNSVLSAVKNNV